MDCHLTSARTVRLPCYSGYNHIAIWPSSQMVISRNVIKKNAICFFEFQNCSYYGLLDVNSILSPIKTGEWVELAFRPGFFYAAYKATESCQVNDLF